jgi:uncharacterized protein YndB with AHSA1/START domain
MANPLQLLKLKPVSFQFIEELAIDAAPAKVWKTLLNMNSWFHFDPDPAKWPKSKIDARAGGQVLVTNPAGYSVLFGTVTLIEPGKLLRIGGSIGMSHLPINSVIIFELQPQRGGKSTLLRFCQRSTGLATPDLEKNARRNWKSTMLKNLKEAAE